jgi:Tfp pilus assembly protein PilN
MSLTIAKSESLTLGAIPRVHLLPPEVEAHHKAQGIRRLLITGLIGAVAVVALAVGTVTVGLFSANAHLGAAQSRTAALIAQQGQYSSVVSVQNQVTDITGLQPLASTGEILWQPYVATLQSTLPADTNITMFEATLQTVPDPKETVSPLQGAHIATITITADSPKAPISDWLDNLAKLKGFVDATPGSVTLVPQTGRYTVSVALHVDADALANRFVVGKK